MTLRILVIHNYYQQGGGEHTVFENEVQLLREHGDEVFTYTKDNKDLKSRPWKLLLLPFATIWSFSSYRAVKRLIREKKIDLVHCHNTFPQISPSVYYAAWHCGVSVVQTVHNFRFVCPNGLCFRDGHICEECLQKGVTNALHYGCYRNSWIQTLPVVLMLAIHRCAGTYKRLYYIFLTQFAKDKIALKLGVQPERAFVRGNCVKVGQQAAADSWQMNKFVYAGRLDSYKGVEWMLKRFSQHPDLRLIVFGDGQLRELVRKYAAEYENIEWRGYCPQEKIFYELSSACALVFPSLLYEGFPMMIAESFAAGVPVLSSNIGNGGRMIRETGGGVVCDPESDASFENAVETLINDHAVLARNACQAAQQWSALPSWKSLKSIYEEITRYGGAKS